VKSSCPKVTSSLPLGTLEVAGLKAFRRKSSWKPRSATTRTSTPSTPSSRSVTFCHVDVQNTRNTFKRCSETNEICYHELSYPIFNTDALEDGDFKMLSGRNQEFSQSKITDNSRYEYFKGVFSPNLAFLAWFLTLYCHKYKIR